MLILQQQCCINFTTVLILNPEFVELASGKQLYALLITNQFAKQQILQTSNTAALRGKPGYYLHIVHWMSRVITS